MECLELGELTFPSRVAPLDGTPAVLGGCAATLCRGLAAACTAWVFPKGLL